MARTRRQATLEASNDSGQTLIQSLVNQNQEPVDVVEPYLEDDDDSLSQIRQELGVVEDLLSPPTTMAGEVYAYVSKSRVYTENESAW